MSVTPTGPLSKPLNRLRTLLSESATWQTWTGSADATEALEHIYLVEADPDEVTRPFAVVGFGDSYNARAEAGGAGQVYVDGGELFLMFEDEPDSEHSAADAELTFLNNVGNSLSEMLEISGTDAYLTIEEITLDWGPARSRREEGDEDDYYQIAWRVNWGI